MTIPDEILAVAAILGGGQPRLEFAQFLLAMIATIQLGTTFDHVISPSHSDMP